MAGDARADILRRIREGLETALLPAAAPEPPAFAAPRPSDAGADTFAEEARRLSAEVIHAASAGDAVRALVDLFAARGWREALAWQWAEIGVPGLGEALAQAGVTVAHDGDPAALEPVPVGLTGAEAAIADTGTIVLRSGAGRSPLASLLPPVHVALVPASRIYPDMLAYVEALEAAGSAAGHVRAASNLVFISGPSRTADIEQTLTLGVHGPRELILILWG